MKRRIALALLLLGCEAASIPDAGGDASSDSDGDGIPDVREGETRDTDGDGTPDRLDLDSDDDGIPDAIEGAGPEPPDSDGDGDADYVDLDSDDNGVLDADEHDGDTDGDGAPDRIDPDDDGDFMPDAAELAFPGALEDGDGDGLVGLRDPDSDGDTVRDGHEPLDVLGDGVPDLHQLDSDADGWLDAEEAGDADLGTAPVDTDGDAVADMWDLDSDNDGLEDAEERALGSSRSSGDTDGDGVPDLVEVAACPSFDPSCAGDVTDASRSPSGRVDHSIVVARGAAPDPDRVTFVFILDAPARELRPAYADGARDSVDTEALFVDQVALRTDPGPFGCEAFGASDAFRDVPAGATVCVELVARGSASVEPEPDVSQIFLGFVRLVGPAGENVAYRGVVFRVPPAGF